MKEEAAKRAALDQQKREEAMHGNALIDLGGGARAAEGAGGMKRKWYEDTVFRNQARGEPKAQRRFVNDTVRSDFHKKFLERYLK